MSELTKEERKQKTIEMRERAKKVEEFAKYRKAQEELQEKDLNEITTISKHNIVKAMSQELSNDETKYYKQLQLKVVQMNYIGSIIGLFTAAILPRNFRAYQKQKIFIKVPICIGLFILTQRATAFNAYSNVDDFEIQFIEKHRQQFLQNIYEL